MKEKGIISISISFIYKAYSLNENIIKRRRKEKRKGRVRLSFLFSFSVFEDFSPDFVSEDFSLVAFVSGHYVQTVICDDESFEGRPFEDMDFE